MKRFGIGVAVLAVCLYLADAIFPTWNFECSINRADLFPSVPIIPELAEDPNARVFWPTKVKGCTLTPNNKARHVFEAAYTVVHWFDGKTSGR